MRKTEVRMGHTAGRWWGWSLPWVCELQCMLSVLLTSHLQVEGTSLIILSFGQRTVRGERVVLLDRVAWSFPESQLSCAVVLSLGGWGLEVRGAWKRGPGKEGVRELTVDQAMRSLSPGPLASATQIMRGPRGAAHLAPGPSGRKPLVLRDITPEEKAMEETRPCTSPSTLGLRFLAQPTWPRRCSGREPWARQQVPAL